MKKYHRVQGYPKSSKDNYLWFKRPINFLLLVFILLILVTGGIAINGCIPSEAIHTRIDGIETMSVTYLWQGDYVAETAYVPNDVVYYSGSCYLCIDDTTGNLPTNETYWDLMVSKGDTGSAGAQGAQGPAGANGADGEDGEDGVSFVWQGAYDSGHAYVVNDAVIYSNTIYICHLNSTGNAPSNDTYWDICVDLSGWTGNSNVATVGTITTGTWNGTDVAPGAGGTGVSNGSNNTITFSGNYGLTLTLSNTTSLTLPTSGTLSNLVTAGLAKITVGTSEPSTPGTGDLWLDTN